ncbi:hypothetical protein [Paraburkholderia sp. J8-2]|uniref:hypothetical protein n=1 Tax=Paraburkholderia sp. J8-2 TaxID=2805440 RepID=UPI002AB69AC7|nr:hypothetical protein [Paraburkholderia sp. J8-2]
MASGIDTNTFNQQPAGNMADTFSGCNSFCLLPARRPARQEDEGGRRYLRVWNFNRPPGVLVKATVLPLNPIVEK